MNRFFAGLILVLFATSSSTLAQGVLDYDVADFGSRPAWVCGPFGDDSPGGLNAEEIMIVFKCAEESDNLGYDQRLYLWEDIDFRPGPPRAPNASEAMMMDFNLDEMRIYPFSGTATEYQCSRNSEFTGNVGKNCVAYRKRGEGSCYFSTRGVWYCHFRPEGLGDVTYDVPPPTDG